MMYFETFHAERERIRKEKQTPHDSATASGLQKYLDGLQERRRRDADYIDYLLARGEERRASGRIPAKTSVRKSTSDLFGEWFCENYGG